MTDHAWWVKATQDGTRSAAAGHADEVRALFDGKAAGWPDKYAADGRLAGRLPRLADAVAALATAGGDLLDLGCGSGELARHLAVKGYRVTGCDIAPQMLSKAAAADPDGAVRWVALDARWRSLPYPAASLDAVVASSVLEYVPDAAVVLAESARVLRPGGIMLCTVPNVAHPVRWLEWPFVLAARTPLAAPLRRLPGWPGQYLAYLLTSRHRHWVRWWHAAARLAGVEPVAAPVLAAATGSAGREPLRLLAFMRSAGATSNRLPGTGTSTDSAGGRQ